ncbi:MAG TPA: hypothetical protein PKA58_06230 [Polyangium sp.]|nr:hypothetical protein [Polyangium sp.]
MNDQDPSSDELECYETPPEVLAQIAGLWAKSPEDREAWMRDFNAADGKAFAAHLAEEDVFQKMLVRFATIAPLPPSLAGLRVVSSGMPLQYDRVPLHMGDKQIGWARDVVVTTDQGQPRVDGGTFDVPNGTLTLTSRHAFKWASPALAESPGQRERRQARNRRKAARRKAKR